MGNALTLSLLVVGLVVSRIEYAMLQCMETLRRPGMEPE